MTGSPEEAQAAGGAIPELATGSETLARVEAVWQTRRIPAKVAEGAGTLILLDEFGNNIGWQERALCQMYDPETFFPEKGGSSRAAKQICARCEVKGECLEWAITQDVPFGVWGGLSERERRRLKRRVA